MTVAIVNQITAAVVTLLSASGGLKPSGLTVTRYRTVPYLKTQFPAMVVYALRDQQLERVGLEDAPVSDRQFRFCVECRVIVDPSTTQSIDEALDPLLTWAVTALEADPHLGGLTTGLQVEDLLWDAADLDRLYGGLQIVYQAHYSVLAADPTQTPG